MTRKDCELIAKCLRKARERSYAYGTALEGRWAHIGTTIVLEELEVALTIDNPKFKADKFRDAVDGR